MEIGTSLDFVWSFDDSRVNGRMDRDGGQGARLRTEGVSNNRFARSAFRHKVVPYSGARRELLARLKKDLDRTELQRLQQWRPLRNAREPRSQELGDRRWKRRRRLELDRFMEFNPDIRVLRAVVQRKALL